MRILVVEDYPPLRLSIMQGLKEAGFAVDAAANGNDGLWHAEGNAYDVIVLDLMLPGLDGLSLLRRVRAKGLNACVLILTARDAVEERVAGLNAGADDYLIKPFAFEELLARVQALIRRRYEQQNPVISVSNLTIDTAAREVTRGGERIELTGREYALLLYLAMRAGQTVSRREIWEHIYEEEEASHSNVIDVYIRYLRRKLERPDWEPLIHTRRGLGYRLGVENSA